MIASNEIHARQFLFRDVYKSPTSEGATVSGFWRKLTARQFARLFGPFIGALAAGFALTYWYPSSWPWQEIVKVLRDALIVAGIIGPLIEIWAASLLIDEATDELSSRLVGYGLPRDAQTLIHKLVHETRLVYRDYHKVYRIIEHPEMPAEKVLVHLTLSYRVVNNGKRTEKYVPSLAEEGMYKPMVTTLEYAGNCSARQTRGREHWRCFLQRQQEG